MFGARKCRLCVNRLTRLEKKIPFSKIPGYIRTRRRLQKIDLGLRAQCMISKSNVKVYVLMIIPALINNPDITKTYAAKGTGLLQNLKVTYVQHNKFIGAVT